jgi:hypothetical protein
LLPDDPYAESAETRRQQFHRRRLELLRLTGQWRFKNAGHPLDAQRCGHALVALGNQRFRIPA